MKHVLFLFCTLLLYANGKLIFHNATEIKDSFEAPSFQFIDASKTINITGRLVLADPKDACSKIKNADDLNGNIVLVIVGTGCKVVEAIQRVQDAGAITFVYARQSGFPGDFAGTTYFNAHKIKISGIEIVLGKYYHKAQDITGDTANNITVSITNGVRYTYIINFKDPYDDKSFYVAFSIIIGLWSFINLILGLNQLRRFVIRYGFQPSLAQVCLYIELFANSERIIMTVEPTAGIRRGCYDFYLLQAFTTMSVPFTFITCGLIALYWNRILRTFSKRVQHDVQVFSLEKWKIPFVLFAVVILLLELLADLFRGSVIPSGGAIEIINGVIYIIVALVGAVWFAYNGIRMLRFLKSSSSLLASSRTAGMQRLTKLVCIISFGMLMVMIGAALTTVVSAPIFRSGLMLAFLGLNLVSLAQILMFRVEGVTESQTPNVESGTVPVEMKSTASSHNSITN